MLYANNAKRKNKLPVCIVIAINAIIIACIFFPFNTFPKDNIAIFTAKIILIKLKLSKYTKHIYPNTAYPTLI